MSALWDFLVTPSWGLICLIVAIDWGSFALLRYLEGLLARLKAQERGIVARRSTAGATGKGARS